MKNLKKVLALVLVVATLCGFATSAGATDFSDAASVKNSEAVEVMSALGVIKGYTDGSFKPGNNVTRAEMAKMVTAILNGGEDVGPLYSAANVFTDCGYHWARGYIAYATQVKLVAGIGGGKFNPDGNVTGTEAAKMLLCALGYEPEREGLVGTTWAAKTLSLAREAGLTDGFAANFDFSRPLNRDDAAQMMLNALKAPVVEYSDDAGTIIVGGVEVVTGGRRANKIAVKTAENTMKDNNDDLQLGEKSFDGDLGLIASNKDAFGRPSLKWTYNKKEIGTYNNAEPVLTYTKEVKSKDIYKDLDLSEAVGNQEYVLDGDDTVTADAGTNVISIVKGEDKPIKGSGNGTVTEVYEITKTVGGSEVDTYRIVVVNEYLAQVSTVVKAKGDDARYITLKNVSGSISLKDSGKFETEDFAKDDWVLITVAEDSGLVVKSVKAVEVVENVNVTAYKNSDSVTAGGTKYSYSKNVESGSAATAYKMGDDDSYTLYLDSCGNVIKSEEYSVSNEDYVYILASKAGQGVGSSTYSEVEYIDATGKVATTRTKSTVSNNTWYTISDDKDNSGYKKFNTESGHTSATVGSSSWEVSKSTPRVATGILTNASTVFIFKTAADTYKTYTGIANIPTYTGSGSLDVYAVVPSSGYAKVLYADVSAGTASSATDDLIYVVKLNGFAVDNGTTCQELTVIKDGKLDENFLIAQTVDTTGSGVTPAANMLLKVVKTDGDNHPVKFETVSGAKYATVAAVPAKEGTFAYNDGTLVLTLNSVDYEFYTDAETAVYSVTDDGYDAKVAEDLDGAETKANTAIYVIYESDSVKTVAEIYFVAK